MRLLILPLLLLASSSAAQTSYTYVGFGGGAWAEPTNWSPQGVPGIADTAIVETGELYVFEDHEVAALRLTGGTLAGTHTLKVLARAEWDGGDLGDAIGLPDGELAIDNEATFTITCASACRMRGMDLTTRGATRWESGEIISRGGNNTWHNNGPLDLLGGAAGLRHTDSAIHLVNTGTITKRGADTRTLLESPFARFSNAGTVRVASGALDVAMKGSDVNEGNGGDWIVDAAAQLVFSLGDQYDYAGSTVRGDGQLAVGKAVVTFGRGDLSGEVLLNGDGSLRFSDPDRQLDDTRIAHLRLQQGGFGGHSAKVVDRLTWTGGRLGARGALYDDNLLQVQTGTLTGPATKRLDGVSLTSTGSLVWDEGDLLVTSSNALTVAEGATFELAGSGQWTRTGGFVEVDNQGMILKSSSGTTLVELPFAPFDNNGLVRVAAGQLQLNISDRGSRDTGDYEIAEGATLRFGPGERAFVAKSEIRGLGTLSTVGADLDLEGSLSPGLAEGDIGTLRFNGDLAPLTGQLTVDLGGSTPGTEHDHLVGNGAVTLDGARLRVRLAEGYVPTSGERFTIIQGRQLAGAFDQISGPDGFQFAVEVEGQTATLVVVLGGACPSGLQPDEATVALYPFDEALPGIAYDLSGNDRHALSDGTTVEAGAFCSARRFDGVDDALDLQAARAALDLATAWTLELVARSDGGGEIPALVNEEAQHGWMLRHKATVIDFGIKTDAAATLGDWTARGTATAPALDDDWHYYALAWDGAWLRVYHDGTLLDSLAAAGTPRLGQMTVPAHIGRDEGEPARYFSGGLDGLRVSDRARTPEEIFDAAVALGFATAVSTEHGSAVTALALAPPAPNPARGATTITLDLPTPTRARLALYDALGREVAVALDDDRPAGRHAVTLATDGLAPGVYVVRLSAGTEWATRRLTIVR